MIEVDHLTKFYGTHAAVADVSFAVESGQILGFLGPNGAGKTTTMRILTGFIPATSGTARVAGFDVFEESREVRRRIGYLPENPPLYADMTPTSYLDFVARIKGVPRGERAAVVSRALEITATDAVARQPIGTLSRGYKQRVAIGQALVHDPEVVVLDEPTIGLDPKQIISIRQLIRDLAESRTVILSTHILPEVTQVCNRVVIISDGRIVLDDDLGSLIAGEDLEQVFLRVTTGEAGSEAVGDEAERTVIGYDAESTYGAAEPSIPDDVGEASSDDTDPEGGAS